MKKQITIFLFIFFVFPAVSFAVSVPTSVTLTNITQTSITVNWIGDSEAIGYIIYWGTSSSALNQTYQVSSSMLQYTITGLTSGTTYYVQVSAYDASGVGGSSAIQQATTSDTSPPAVPTGFTVSNPDVNIADSSVTFTWNQNTESDFNHCNIYYGTVSGSYGSPVQTNTSNATAFAVTGLTSSTRYYFAIAAVDTSSNESAKSEELIVDTLPDKLPPYTPTGLSAALSGQNEITVSISGGNSQIADYAGNIIFYGTASGAYDKSIDIGKNTSHVFDHLPEGSTWYYAASAYDVHGNQSPKSAEVSSEIEKTVSFLGQTDKFEGGCFIGAACPSSFSAFPLLLLMLIIGLCCAISKKVRMVIGISALILFTDYHAFSGEAQQIKNNVIGITAGYFMPSESSFNDFYNKSIFSVFGFYEHRIYKFVTADIEAGFLRKDGHLMTESGAATAIKSVLTMVPVSVSLKLEKEMFPYIIGYIGVGPDYWFCQEKTDIQTADNSIKDWVGGYHAKIGIKLHNRDKEYENTGAIIECVYSRINRFGSNDLDVGGLTVTLGFFYQF